jgi:hypothetical protein
MPQMSAFRPKKRYSAILRLYQLLCNMFKSGKRTHFDLFIRSIPRIFAPILYGRAKEGAAQSSKSFVQSSRLPAQRIEIKNKTIRKEHEETNHYSFAGCTGAHVGSGTVVVEPRQVPWQHHNKV